MFNSKRFFIFISRGQFPNTFSASPASDCKIKESICYFGNYEWLILEKKNNKALLLAKDVVALKPYNTTVDSVTWETSTLRAWLNNRFLNEFTSQEQAKIVLTTNVNPDNPSYGTAGGNNTIDLIFLLSIPEARRYFSDRWARTAQYDDSELAWWLRSPGDRDNDAALVDPDGDVDVNGLDVNYDDYGVRPALWLNL
ncbi:MAG: DUF6273 domain-containing protein [Myxococcales bacterium]|nr:DUF6273 domain-containing protein [Myxococcales bacterium]